jgi:hypothetical protein
MAGSNGETSMREIAEDTVIMLVMEDRERTKAICISPTYFHLFLLCVFVRRFRK